MFAPPICRRSRRKGREQSQFFNAVVSSDPTKTAAPGEHRSERSEPLDTASSASEAVLFVDVAHDIADRGEGCLQGLRGYAD
jgi:hypothetical protein